MVSVQINLIQVIFQRLVEIDTGHPHTRMSVTIFNRSMDTALFESHQRV